MAATSDSRITLKPGRTIHCKRIFTQDDFNGFARLSGDDNPIHVDPEFSARTRFRKTVSHGMLLYATIYQSLAAQFPGMTQREQEVMFPNPTYVGEELTIELKVAAVLDERRVRLAVLITKQDETAVCEGSTLILLPE